MELLQSKTPLKVSSLSYDFFFDNLDNNLRVGIGFSLFEANESAISSFANQCARNSCSTATIRLSTLGDSQPNLPTPKDLVVIIQDLPFEDFLGQAAFIADQLIFPLWFKRVSMCFFSIPGRGAYNNLRLSGDNLHKNYGMVVNSLLCEQIFVLLERVNIQPSSPNFVPLSDGEAFIEAIRKKPEHNKFPKYPLDDDLDTSQIAAAGSITGPIRVLAPAGSGKTKTLINRILNLLNQGIPPKKILALAFNKKARDEMQERLERKGIHGIQVRTFHSLGYEIVRKSLGWKYSGVEHKNLPRDLMRNAIRQHTELPPLRNKDPLDAFLDGLRKAKMDLPDLTTLTVEYGERIYPFEPIFYSYLKAQLDRNYLDFDDMIYMALRVLLDNRSLRHAYQSQFEYVLVDEFQDLNQAQLLLLQILSLPENNVFAVGDDDQMIYGFRGAEVRHIIEFDKRFPVSSSHVLNTNYRSSQMIVRHTGWLIDHNSDRVEKNIQPRPGSQEGSFEISGHASVLEQAEYAAQWLMEHKTKNRLRWSDYAFLFRYNAYQFPVAIVLDTLNVPHSPLSGQNLFRTRVGKDVYSYFQVTLSPLEATPKDFECLLKRPNKYFTNQLIARARDWKSLQRLPQDKGLRQWEREKLIDFIGRIENLSKKARDSSISPADFMHTLIIGFGLGEFYREQSRLSADIDQASNEDLVDVILALSENFKTVNDFYEFVCKSIDDDETASVSSDVPGDKVYLGTIHRAKGKEFRNVIYFNLCKNGRFSEKIQEEEERRVAYVAATRPKDSLLITFPSAKPSTFLSEICLNPRFKGITDEYLERWSASMKMRIKKEKTKQGQIKRHRDRLVTLFEKLTDESSSNQSTFLLQLTEMYLNWRIQKAQQKIGFLNEKIKKHTETVIQPLLVELNDLDEEIKLRKAIKPVSKTGESGE